MSRFTAALGSGAKPTPLKLDANKRFPPTSMNSRNATMPGVAGSEKLNSGSADTTTPPTIPPSGPVGTGSTCSKVKLRKFRGRKTSGASNSTCVAPDPITAGSIVTGLEIRSCCTNGPAGSDARMSTVDALSSVNMP